MKVGLTELIQDYCAKSVPKIANEIFQSFVYIIAEQKATISCNNIAKEEGEDARVWRSSMALFALAFAGPKNAKK